MNVRLTGVSPHGFFKALRLPIFRESLYNGAVILDTLITDTQRDLIAQVNIIRQTSLQTFIVLIMLTSWLFMLATSACIMPTLLKSPVEAVAVSSDCDEAVHGANHQVIQVELQKQDCLLKPCPDSQQTPAFNLKNPQLDIPVFLLCLLGLSFIFYPPAAFRISRRHDSDHFANTVPIRYRFCVLLN